jgi:hypothetical protein
MRMDTIAVALMMAAFLLFAATLFWADHQTRGLSK